MSNATKTKPCAKCGYEYDRHTFFRCPNCYNLAKQATIKQEFEKLYAKVQKPTKGSDK